MFRKERKCLVNKENVQKRKKIFREERKCLVKKENVVVALTPLVCDIMHAVKLDFFG